MMNAKRFPGSGWLKIALLCTSLIQVFFAGPVIAEIFGDDSRKDPVCYDDETGTRAFSRASKAVGTYMNDGVVMQMDGTPSPNGTHRCVAFLISPGNAADNTTHNLFLTNSHCLATSATRSNMRVVFGRQSISCGSADTTPSKVYHLSNENLILDLPELDMALFRIIGDPAIEDGFGWLEIDPNTRLTNIWWSPSFGEGRVTVGDKRTVFIPTRGLEDEITDNRPKVAWDSECVVSEVPRDCSEIQERLDAIAPGLWDVPPKACLEHKCDTKKGSSGAPILDTPTNMVIAMNTGQSGGVSPAPGYAVKIRNLWPQINQYIDYRDADNDGLPDIRDNCDYVPNTGRCTDGRIGFGCFVDSDCDTILNSGDGECEGFQIDSDNDGTGDVCEELPPDPFEPNDLPLQAKAITPGTHGLTIDTRLDEDFFIYTTEEDSGTVRISVDASADQGVRELGIDLRYRQCETCPSVLAPAVLDYETPSSRGWRHEAPTAPAGRIYELHVFSLGLKGPINYRLTINTDPNEPNDTMATATEWTQPGCDFTGTLSLEGVYDVDYYKIPATGASVEVQAYFDEGQDLEIYLDGIPATEIGSSGDRQTRLITGCGQEPSYIQVRGDEGSYDLCIKHLPIQASCGQADGFEPFAGTGYFQFNQSSPFSPIVKEILVQVNKRMFARLIMETSASVIWEILGTVDYGKGFNQLFRGQMVIPRPNPDVPVIFEPLGSGTPLLFEAVPGRVAWHQVSPGENGEALFTGPDDAIDSFDVRVQGLQWNASMPQDTGTFVLQAGRDEDRDGLRGDIEVETGTDPGNPDTDGDGLLDGTEDANGNGLVDAGETDPRLFDTDGDGLSDGKEVGTITPDGSSIPLTERDSDPYTFTDPTRSDTDGDGRSDGEEDANLNGRQDPGESSPNIPDAVASSWIINGGAYNFPQGGRYRASFSMDVSTDAGSTSGDLNYYFTRTRMRFVSTAITEVSVEEWTATIVGEGTVNGATGYAFITSITDGTPDTFGITITDSNGAAFYTANPNAVSGGDLVITNQ